MKFKNQSIVALTVATSVMLSCATPANESRYDGTQLWLQSRTTETSATIECCDSTSTLKIACRELSTFGSADTVTFALVANAALGTDGYVVKPQGSRIVVEAQTPTALLYGAYYLSRCEAVGNLPKGEVQEVPAYDIRAINHWDNLDGTIERGYAGQSLWQWDELPATVSPRYEAYARANASIGINAVVLNNVNAAPEILSAEYLEKVTVIADIFRDYGIKTYLSVNFASPSELGGLPDADPLRPEVGKWWNDKVREIYNHIPDFGGFLVKANSEGLPGPLDYGRSHADGANMLAAAMKPFGGIIMWRAFVYSPADADRAKQAYLEFQPHDGEFADNVIIQIKNGPVDFQPREPFSPLFGAMPKTQVMAEYQITQEYTGFSNHVCFLPTMWLETQNADTYSYGEGSTIAKITQGEYTASRPTAIAGVANTGDSDNWCAHPLAQANWYAFGRMAWDDSLTSDQMANEWIRLTFGKLSPSAEAAMKEILLQSHEAVVDYMMPLGLHHLFAWSHHYGPEPWCDIEGARLDWMPRYYHRADTFGVGFDRSPSGSKGNQQYSEPLASLYGDIATCPDEYLLWFHHAAWTHTMQSGRTLWDEMCFRYKRGLDTAEHFVQQWQTLQNQLPHDLWLDVANRLDVQRLDARWWHDACLLYFQQYSNLPIPQGTLYNLDDMMKFRIDITNFECPKEGYVGN